MELYYILIFYGNFGQIMVIDFQVNNVAHGPRLKTFNLSSRCALLTFLMISCTCSPTCMHTSQIKIHRSFNFTYFNIIVWIEIINLSFNVSKLWNVRKVWCYASSMQILTPLLPTPVLGKEIQQLTSTQHPALVGLSHTHANISVDQRKNVPWHGNRYFQTELLGNALAR